MRYVNLRLWVALALSILLLLATSVGAQQVKIIPAPGHEVPPHVQQCANIVATYGNYIVMRLAGVTKEESLAMFAISMKVAKYMESKGGDAVVKNWVDQQRMGIDEVYSMPTESIESRDHLRIWAREKTMTCIAENTPATPDGSGSGPNRMIPK